MQALLSLMDQDWSFFAETAAHAWMGWPSDAEGRQMADWVRTATTPSVAKRVLQAATAVDVTAELARVQCPVLVLHRRDATVVPLEVSRELVAALPNARLEILDGTSATLFFERGDEAVDRVLAFIVGGADRASVPASRGGGGAAPRAGGQATLGRNGPSPREVEVLRLIAAGETNASIAARLGIAEHTVERHAANLYRKIDARGRADATAYAIRHGLA